MCKTCSKRRWTARNRARNGEARHDTGRHKTRNQRSHQSVTITGRTVVILYSKIQLLRKKQKQKKEQITASLAALWMMWTPLLHRPCSWEADGQSMLLILPMLDGKCRKREPWFMPCGHIYGIKCGCLLLTLQNDPEMMRAPQIFASLISDLGIEGFYPPTVSMLSWWTLTPRWVSIN